MATAPEHDDDVGTDSGPAPSIIDPVVVSQEVVVSAESDDGLTPISTTLNYRTGYQGARSVDLER